MKKKKLIKKKNKIVKEKDDSDSDAFCTPLCHLHFCQSGEIPPCCWRRTGHAVPDI